jgi:DNA-binding NarL/FixJ family response regulator
MKFPPDENYWPRPDSDAYLCAGIPLPQPTPPPCPLSPRQLEVLTLLAAGCGDKAIARKLKISVNTVGHHCAAILARLDADSRSQAVAIAMRAGWLI